MNVQKVFDTIQPIFEKYQHEEHIEFEMRLGKFNCGVFDTDVSKEKFEFMMDGLKKYTGWEKILSTNEEVYYRENDNLRISIDEDAETETIIHKETIHKENFSKLKNTPYDLRFSVSREVPVEQYDGEMDKKKTKERTSFIRKNLSIDLTVVTGESEDMDSEESTTYQVEFEIIDPKKVEDDEKLLNIIHKVKDLFNMFKT